MKPILVALCLFALGLPLQADLYVAPGGDDTNPGTEAAPFATLERARQEVRTINSGMDADLVVQVAPGNYPVTTPLAFDASDSGMNGHKVIYRASANPGSARILGGQLVTNWQPYQGQIVMADLGLPGFHTLYENGRRARKARYPNLVPDPELPLARASYLRAAGTSGSYTQLQYAAGSLDPSGWGLTDAQIHLWPGGKWAWFSDTVPIASINRGTRTITLAEDARYPIYASGVGSRFFVQGVLDLLDEPGEFHYDSAAGRLYYWPMDGPAADQEIVVPQVKRILSLQGGSDTDRVHDLRFEGLGLEFTDFTNWYRHAHVSAGDAGGSPLYPQFDRQATMPQHREGAVFLENTESISFDACVVRNTGYSGFGSFGANRNNTFQRLSVSHAGVHGLLFEGLYPGEGDVETLNTVDNCYIHDVGELAGQGAGVQLTNASHHEIAYCVIEGSPRYAVSLNAYVDIPLADIYIHDNRAHHLRIRACCQDSGDTAPIYAWGLSDDAPYHLNYFEQLLIDDTRAHSSMTDYAPNAVFLDNDTFAQQLTDIDVRNSQSAAFRTNSSTGHVMTNVSWQTGFAAERMHYDTIGVRADHPFAVPPVRLIGDSSGSGVALSWLPVANATGYTVEAAADSAGPWEVLAAGLTTTSYADPTPSGETRHYRVFSTGPLGTDSQPSTVVAVLPPQPPQPPGVITFETDQGYPAASYDISVSPGTAADAPFDGVNGWSRSVSDNSGQVTTTTTAGEYTGGQALAATGTGTYIGGLRGVIQHSGETTIRFDAQYSSGIAVGFMAGVDGDDLFDLGDCGMGFGVGGSPGRFQYRDAAFGTDHYGAGFTGTTGHWYRFTVTIGSSVGGSRDIVMTVRNLSTGTDFDFDALTVGIQPWSFAVTDAAFGTAPETSSGIFARASGNSRIDNIHATLVGTSYDIWMDSFPQLIADPRLPEADPDADGTANLLEFVLDGNPTASDPGIRPQSAMAGDDFVITFRRRDDAEGYASLILQHSTDLGASGPWSDVVIGAGSGASGGVSWVVEELGADPDLITVTVPASNDARRFVRLKVTVSPS